MEYFLREETFPAFLARNKNCVAANRLRTEERCQGRQILFRRGFVESDADRIRIDDADQAAALVGFGCDCRGFARDLGRYRIEQAFARNFNTGSLERGSKTGGQSGHAHCNRLQASRAMPDGESCGHVGQKRLRGADIGGRLVAADVLLAGLERQTIGRAAMRIDRLADDAARNNASEHLGHCKISRVRAAKAHRHAIALHGADGHVRAPPGRRFHDGERQRIGNGDNQRALGLGIGNDLGKIAIDAARIRPWNHDCGGVVVNIAAGGDLPAERFSAGVHHIDRLRMQFASKQNAAALVAMMAAGNADGFGNGSRLVEQRGTGNRQAGQFGNQCLEVEQKLKAALADFRLVGRISRVPGRVFKQVALDDRRRVNTVIARADEALLHHVAAHDRAQFRKCVRFAERRWQVQRAVEANGGRNRLRYEGFHGRKAERCQHGALVFMSRPDMAGHKGKKFGHSITRSAFHNRPCRAGP